MSLLVRKSKYEVAYVLNLNYVFVVTIVHVDNGVSLEPCAYVSELAVNNTDRPQERIIEVDLVHWVSPAVTNAEAFQLNSSRLGPGFVDDDFSGEGWHIVTTERFTSNVQRSLLESGPCFVEIIEEVQQMVSSLMGA